MTFRLSIAVALTVLEFVNVAHCQPKLDRYGDPLPPGAIARLGTMRFRHLQRIIEGAYSADGKRIIGLAHNGVVRVWDAESGRVLETLQAGNSWSTAMAAAPKSGLAAILIWRFDSTTQKHRRVIHVIDTQTGKTRQLIAVEDEREYRCLTWSPDEKTLAAGRRDGIVQIWEAATGKLLRQEQVSENGIDNLSFSPDGQTIAAAGYRGLRLWNWDAKQAPTAVPVGTDRSVTNVTFSEDGKLLAVVLTGEKGVFLIDAQTHKTRRVLRPRGPSRPYFSDVVFTPDGRYLVGSDHRFQRILVWSIPSGDLVRSIDVPLVRPGKLAVSSNSRRIATYHDAVVRQWELPVGREIHPFADAHLGESTQLAFNRDPQTIATAGRDGVVRVWSVKTQEQRFMMRHDRHQVDFPWVLGLAYSPDRRWIASTGADNTTRLWNARSGEQVYRLPGHGRGSGRWPIAFSPDSRRFTTTGGDMRLRVWDVRTGKALAEHWLRLDDFEPPGVLDIDDQILASPYVALSDHLDFRPKGISHNPARLFGTCRGAVHSFDPATGKKLNSLMLERVGYLAPSSTGRTVFAGSYARTIETPLPDGQVRTEIPKHHTLALINTETGRPMWTINDIEGFPGPVAYSPDDQLVAAAPNNSPREIHIYNSMGERRQTIRGFDAEVVSLAFSADGRLLAAGLSDTSVLVWKVTP